MRPRPWLSGGVWRAQQKIGWCPRARGQGRESEKLHCRGQCEPKHQSRFKGREKGRKRKEGEVWPTSQIPRKGDQEILQSHLKSPPYRLADARDHFGGNWEGFYGKCPCSHHSEGKKPCSHHTFRTVWVAKITTPFLFPKGERQGKARQGNCVLDSVLSSPFKRILFVIHQCLPVGIQPLSAMMPLSGKG